MTDRAIQESNTAERKADENIYLAEMMKFSAARAATDPKFTGELDAFDRMQIALSAMSRARAEERERCAAELAWAWARPDDVCGSKCDWCKGIDPNGCYCGRKEWEEKKPEHLKTRHALPPPPSSGRG